MSSTLLQSWLFQLILEDCLWTVLKLWTFSVYNFARFSVLFTLKRHLLMLIFSTGKTWKPLTVLKATLKVQYSQSVSSASQYGGNCHCSFFHFLHIGAESLLFVSTPHRYPSKNRHFWDDPQAYHLLNLSSRKSVKQMWSVFETTKRTHAQKPLRSSYCLEFSNVHRTGPTRLDPNVATGWSAQQAPLSTPLFTLWFSGGSRIQHKPPNRAVYSTFPPKNKAATPKDYACRRVNGE